MVLTAQEFEALMPDGTQLLSDEPEMESSLHYTQLLLLVTCLERLWQGRSDFFIGANLTIYYSRQQLKTRDFRGPDFFVVKGVEKHDRNAWVVWEENGTYPDVIIELLSESTARVDRGLKKQLYQDRFQTSEYFWFYPQTLEFAGFRLMGGQYGAIEATKEGWYWSEELELYLGIWERRLRYFTAQGQLVPTPEEAEQQERQRTEQEHQRADQEQQRAEHERQRAEQAQQQVQQAQQRAEQERQRAVSAEERVRQLEAELRRLQGQEEHDSLNSPGI